MVHIPAVLGERCNVLFCWAGLCGEGRFCSGSWNLTVGRGLLEPTWASSDEIDLAALRVIDVDRDRGAEDPAAVTVEARGLFDGCRS